MLPHGLKTKNMSVNGIESVRSNRADFFMVRLGI